LEVKGLLKLSKELWEEGCKCIERKTAFIVIIESNTNIKIKDKGNRTREDNMVKIVSDLEIIEIIETVVRAVTTKTTTAGVVQTTTDMITTETISITVNQEEITTRWETTTITDIELRELTDE
jgi:hypothetical protein